MTAKAKKAIIITCCVIAALAVIGGATVGIYFGYNADRYSGFVYDQDGNPMQGVSVTNGRDVVKTDADGKYVLDGWMKDSFVTVTIPSGYWTEGYYHKVESKRDGYDFTLTKLDKDYTNHNFIQVTDSEISSAKGTEKWMQNVRETVEQEQPAFIIHTGDICYEDGLREHINVMNSENMGVPVRYVIGNHDYIDWGSYGEAYFESIYGPVCYSFEVGNVHYIVTPMVHGVDRAGRYSYKNVYTWLANDLANTDPSKKIVMFNHDYCPDEDGFVLEWGLGGKNKIDLKEKGLLAWVFGHWHYDYMYQTNGVFNVCTGKPDSGNIDSTVPAVRAIRIENDALVSSTMHYYDFDVATPELTAEQGWSTALGGRGEFAEPIYKDGYIYAATTDDAWPKKCGIYKVDAASGEVVWKYDTVNSIRNSMDMTSDGKLVAQDVTGRVYCVDINTGAKIWEKDTALSAARNTGLNVVEDGGKVYCGGAQKTVCLNLADGSLIWETTNERANSAPARMIIDEDKVLVGSHWDELIAYDKNTGKRVWSYDKDGIRNRTTTPVVADGKLYVAAIDTFFELDRATGKPIRSKKYEEKSGERDYNLDTASQPYIDGDTAYVTTSTRGLLAIDLATFEIKWEFVPGPSKIFNSPYVNKGSDDNRSCGIESSVAEKDGYLYFGASDGVVYKIDKSGNEIGSVDIKSPIISKVAFTNDGVAVLDFSGNLSLIRYSAF